MNEDWYVQEFEDDDVIAFGEILMKIGKFREVMKSGSSGIHQDIQKAFENNNLRVRLEKYDRQSRKNVTQSWTSDTGVDSEILRVQDNQWKKGKVKVKVIVEFCYDEPETEQLESPLDDIRQSLINEKP